MLFMSKMKKNVKKVVIVGSALIFSGCANIHADLKTGKEARRAGDYTTAIYHLEPLAEFGVDEARYEYAVAVLRKDSVTAEELIKASDMLLFVEGKRKPQARYELGRLFDRGNGRDLAKQYFQESADLGYTRAYTSLADILADEGDGVAALSLYQKALDSGYHKAAVRIGKMFERGNGVSKDLVQALSWYMIAESYDVPKADQKVSKLSRRLTRQQQIQSKNIFLDYDK